MTAAIELEDVSVRGRLAGATLRVDAGSYVSIVGPPETGKTTLLSVLALLRRPDEGDYVFFGQPTASLTAEGRSILRSHIELVPVECELVPQLTALENVGLGLFHDPSAAAERDHRARCLLERVGIDRFDAPAAHLSGGERRRVAIACSLASRPSLLLCDEPARGLDNEEAKSVLDALDAVRQDDVTIVLTTRSPVVAARADQAWPVFASA
jgi:putative ABC transport system ATP-binding protein